MTGHSWCVHALPAGGVCLHTPHSSPRVRPNQTTTQTYMGVLAVVGAGLTLLYRHYRKREAEGEEPPYLHTVLPVSYAMASAMVGTFVRDGFPAPRRCVCLYV